MRAVFVIVICCVFCTQGIFIFADDASILKAQEEILALAQKRHELMGKNLNIRSEMLKIIKHHRNLQNSEQNELKQKLQPLRDELRNNQKEIRALSKAIQDKRKMLVGLIKTERMHRKDKKKEVFEDISNVD